ncbi:MAG: Flp pilus assembly protein CpaB [Desulfobacteraceae bacterium]|nr:MAG: Flp pilus assembly protein CpaB [Desulfobacteraceae bacterium]
MGNWKAIMPLLLALIIALTGSILVYKWIQAKSMPKETVVAEAKVAPVVVAKLDLRWGTRLNKEMLKAIPFLIESLPPGYFSEPELLEGRVIIAELDKNEPITESKLAPVDVKVGGVSAVLKPGKRAIAVKGDKIIGISGFIKPGNHVDVLVTIKDPKTKKETTKLVLEKIPVLATGTQLQENKKGEPSSVDVYTLEVTPEEGEKLALASNKGRLQFALRNIMDSETVLTRGATISETLSALKPVAKKPVVVKKEDGSPKKIWVRKRSFTVEQIRGDKVSQKKFSD